MAKLYTTLEEKLFFTLEEIAQLFEMTVQGVHAWLRKRKIKEFGRTSKRGKYQIPRREVIRILKASNRAIPGLWVGPRKASTRVLLIDDFEPIRQIAEKAFQENKHGIEIATASNLEDGLLLTAKYEPDIIVLDYIQATDRLRSDLAITFIRNAKLTSKTKVIGMCNSRSIAARMLRAGAQEILLKPFALEELKNAIYRHMGLERRGENRRRQLLAIVADTEHSN